MRKFRIGDKVKVVSGTKWYVGKVGKIIAADDCCSSKYSHVLYMIELAQSSLIVGRYSYQLKRVKK